MQVKQRQDLRDLRRAAHVRGQDRASKPPSLAGGLVHPFVIDPRGLHLDRASPAHDLATLGITVADGQSPPFFVAIGFGHFEVGLYLGLESGSEHLFGSLAGDLVEVEHDLPTSSFVVVYPVPRCTLPADAGTSALPFDCSKGRYTTSLTKSSIHNFRSYLALVAEHGEERSLGNLLLEELYSFVGEGWEQEDDITLLTLRYSSSPS